MPSVNGHIALITGGSRGIGKGIALRLAQGGAKIAINYHQNEKAARETLDQIHSLGGEGIILQADVSKKDEVDKMFEFIQKNMGLVDILVNNAGEGQLRSQSSTDINEDMWDRLYQVNLKGVFLCCAYALPMMIRKMGKNHKYLLYCRPHWWIFGSALCCNEGSNHSLQQSFSSRICSKWSYCQCCSTR